MTGHVYTTDPVRSILSAVCQSAGDPLHAGALRDALLEAGSTEATAGESVPVRVLRPLDVWSFGIGIGRGGGRGGGSGGGSGSGSGGGSGSGSGGGSGSGSGEPYRMRPMKIGTAYLVHCGDWHTFVGRVVEQIGPMTYAMESASKIGETNNGDCWEALAAGDERLRAACVYRHHTTQVVIPLTIAAFEWVGDTPQEHAAKSAGSGAAKRKAVRV